MNQRPYGPGRDVSGELIQLHDRAGIGKHHPPRGISAPGKGSAKARLQGENRAGDSREKQVDQNETEWLFWLVLPAFS